MKSKKKKPQPIVKIGGVYKMKESFFLADAYGQRKNVPMGSIVTLIGIEKHEYKGFFKFKLIAEDSIRFIDMMTDFGFLKVYAEEIKLD